MMSPGTGPANGGRADVDRTPPQPTVMVTGSGGPKLRSVAIELFGARSDPGDGAVVVTTREPPAALSRRLTEGTCGFDPGKLAIVEAGVEAATGVEDGVEVNGGAVGTVRRVAPEADPESVDAAVREALTWLTDEGVERRHFLYDTLATGDRLPDEDAAYDRAYRIAMTVGAEDGLALFTLDTGELSEDAVERLGHLVDVTVELRVVAGTAELRWRGLVGASDGWVGLPDVDLGVGGFR